MIRKFALLLVAAATVGSSAFACETTTGPLLSSVDPFAWAAANANWQGYGNAQVESIKKVVNGQIAAHQVNSSYTCAKCRSVMRVKCSDPANCVMCSSAAGETARKLRTQLNGSIATASGQQSLYEMLATINAYEADVLNAQAKWNELENEFTIEEEVTTADGEVQKTKKNVKVTSAADAERRNMAKVKQAISQAAHSQGQAQGMMVYSYMGAAAESLAKPQPSTALYAGQDPLK